LVGEKERDGLELPVCRVNLRESCINQKLLLFKVCNEQQGDRDSARVRERVRRSVFFIPLPLLHNVTTCLRSMVLHIPPNFDRPSIELAIEET